MLTVFLQALSDVCVDGLLAIHGDHPPNAKMAAGHAAAACHKHCIKLHSASGQACASATLPRASASRNRRSPPTRPSPGSYPCFWVRNVPKIEVQPMSKDASGMPAESMPTADRKRSGAFGPLPARAGLQDIELAMVRGYRSPF